MSYLGQCSPHHVSKKTRQCFTPTIGISMQNGYAHVVVHIKEKNGTPHVSHYATILSTTENCVHTGGHSKDVLTYQPKGIPTLFQSLRVQSHSQVMPMTLNLWILQEMRDVGIDISKYTPYSTRHTSTSAAFEHGMHINDVMALRGWGSLSMFIMHYNLLIVKQAHFSHPTDLTPEYQRLV